MLELLHQKGHKLQDEIVECVQKINALNETGMDSDHPEHRRLRTLLHSLHKELSLIDDEIDRIIRGGGAHEQQ